MLTMNGHSSHHARHRRGIQGLVVVAILKLLAKEPMHGYALLDSLKELFDMDIPKSLVYMTLRRLEAHGFVVSRWETSSSGPARRIYHITEDGVEFLERKLECVRKFMKVCTKILEY